MSRSTLAAGLAVTALAPMVLRAPRRPAEGASLAELEATCRDSGLQGQELVDLAVRLVREQVQEHSIWRPWERPERALRHGRGWAGQYNVALARLLHRLGFDVQVVHAARVRGLGSMPWWQAGHTWVRVDIDGRPRDVTAAHLVGERFAPMSEVRPVNLWTLPTVSLALTPIVAYQAWKGLLTGEEAPRWLAHEHRE